MSGLQLTNPPSDNLNKTKAVNNETDKTVNPIPPNPINPASQCTPAKVSLTYNTSHKQALAITPGMAMQDDSDEDDTFNFLGTVKTEGSDRTTVGPKCANNHQGKVKFNLTDLEDTTVYNTFI